MAGEEGGAVRVLALIPQTLSSLLSMSFILIP